MTTTDDLIDEYVWNRAGEPDVEVRRLEALLARYRHRTPFVLPPDANDDEAVRREDEPGRA